MLDFDEVTHRFCGKSVVEIELNEFACNQRREIIGMILVFESEDVLYVRLDGKGTGFIFEDRRPEKLNLGEYGQTDTIIREVQWKRDLGLPRRVSRIHFEKGSQPIGNGTSAPSSSKVAFAFEGSKVLYIVNNCDEFDVEVC